MAPGSRRRPGAAHFCACEGSGPLSSPQLASFREWLPALGSCLIRGFKASLAAVCGSGAHSPHREGTGALSTSAPQATSMERARLRQSLRVRDSSIPFCLLCPTPLRVSSSKRQPVATPSGSWLPESPPQTPQLCPLEHQLVQWLFPRKELPQPFVPPLLWSHFAVERFHQKTRQERRRGGWDLHILLHSLPGKKCLMGKRVQISVSMNSH